ncbi:hypothetical protein D9M68_1002570 [compost metagenome]
MLTQHPHLLGAGVGGQDQAGGKGERHGRLGHRSLVEAERATGHSARGQIGRIAPAGQLKNQLQAASMAFIAAVAPDSE